VSQFHHHEKVYVIIPRHVEEGNLSVGGRNTTFFLEILALFELHRPPSHIQGGINLDHHSPSYRGVIVSPVLSYGGGDEVVATIMPCFVRLFLRDFSWLRDWFELPPIQGKVNLVGSSKSSFDHILSSKLSYGCDASMPI
jgi:hypothetical protein